MSHAILSLSVSSSCISKTCLMNRSGAELKFGISSCAIAKFEATAKLRKVRLTITCLVVVVWLGMGMYRLS